jgi:hypothetical protein
MTFRKLSNIIKPTVIIINKTSPNIPTVPITTETTIIILLEINNMFINKLQ